MYKFKSKPEISRACRDRHSHFTDRDLLLYLIQRIDHMNQAEQEAFAALTAKAQALVDAVKGLSVEITSDHNALKDALAANDTAGVLEAAAALSSKLDEGLAAAQEALSSPIPGTASASTPVHPSTALPATPDAGSAAPAEPPAQS